MIVVAGAGAFGTALAVALSATAPVTLWSHAADAAAEMERTRLNTRRLPGVTLPAQVSVTAEPECLSQATIVLLAVPSGALPGLLRAHADRLTGKPLVACCKGIDPDRLTGPATTIAEILPGAVPAILTGPSFADDIARGLPTALTLACADAAMAIDLQDRLSTPVLRLYRSTDVAGAELGGALKNVIAIACGASMGLGLGESARAALMTRGFAELMRLAPVFGAKPATLSGLSGLGDLALTCMSEHSRNYRYGLALGRGETFDPDQTVEGRRTAQAVAELARMRSIDMPITAAVTASVSGQIDVREALQALLARPLKEE